MYNKYGYYENYRHLFYGNPTYPVYNGIKCCIYRNEADLSQPLSYNCVYSDTYCPDRIGVWVRISNNPVSDCFYCSDTAYSNK